MTCLLRLFLGMMFRNLSGGSCRVFRGGCWYFFARSCQSAFRLINDPGNRNNNPGFRLLLFIVMPEIRHSRMVGQCVDNDQTLHHVLEFSRQRDFYPPPLVKDNFKGGGGSISNKII
jgi:hypothetical protein